MEREAVCDVTVIVPCRNGAAYLTEMMTSVAGQTAQPRRRILCDDGSTDESAEIARQAGWEVIPTGGDGSAGKGIAVGRNVGLAAADTEFVAFLDADDWWAPDHLADCVALLNQSRDAAMAFGALRKSDSAEMLPVPEWVPKRTQYRPLPALLAINYVPVSAVVARTDIVRRLKGFDGRSPGAEDYDMWLRLAMEGTFIYRDALSLHYRIHAGQISRRTELLGESALRVRLGALQALRGNAGDTRLDDRTIADAETGWEESLDHLWYHGHSESHAAWTKRFREEFGHLPRRSAVRHGVIGDVHMLLRRVAGRSGRT